MSVGGTRPMRDDSFMRTAVILGAGGYVGQAFHLGVLSALAEVGDFDARRADVLVGTSAGSLVAAGLAGGLSVPDLVADLLGQPLSAAGAVLRDAGGASLAAPEVEALPFARRGPLAPAILLAAGRRPWGVRPAALLSGLLPAGRMSTDKIASDLRRVHGDGWPDRDLRICAVRARDGRRVVFGAPGEPVVDVGTAVAASCAIPTYFAPVRAAGETYVDGGVHSPSNADVVAADRIDVAVVLSPMSYGSGTTWLRFELGVRYTIRRYLAAEVRRLRAGGARVLVVAPTPADLQAMGVEPMRGRRVEDVIASAAASTRRRLEVEPELLAALAPRRCPPGLLGGARGYDRNRREGHPGPCPPYSSEA